MANRYTQIIEHIFHAHYHPGDNRVSFAREEFQEVAAQLGIRLPKNLGDLIYTFRYRATLPESLRATAPQGEMWVIRPAGRARYEFVLVRDFSITINALLAETKVPDATPGVVSMYALSDEQALLTKIRYNRLVDIFTGVTCYSLQNHLRTTVPELGQVETDELYVGIDKHGAHYVLPVQAKAGHDNLGPIQVEQDIALCTFKFPNLICRPIGAQFMTPDVIALFEFEMTEQGIRISAEKHYHLVPPENISPADLQKYHMRNAGDL
jgi:hypothetical protein